VGLGLTLSVTGTVSGVFVVPAAVITSELV
jgi:hypothetical protein